MTEKKARKDSTNYVVTSNFGGSEIQIKQLLVVLKQIIKSRETLSSKGA